MAEEDLHNPYAMPQKGHLIAPITALMAVSDTSGDAVVYAGTGGEVLKHDLQTDRCTRRSSTSIFDTHSVHGLQPIGSEDCNAGDSPLLIFGDKALAVCTHTRDGVPVVISRLDLLDDLVLDVTTSSIHHLRYLVIGFAHNFVDIYEIAPYSFAFTKLRRVLGPWRGCLFHLNIEQLCNCCPPAADEGSVQTGIRVSTGTAFGKIDLWELRNLLSGSAVHLVSVTSHEGVIFRTMWSDGMDMLASVSDDRSVRLWDTTELSETSLDVNANDRELFVGWGHISRLWDVAHIPTTGPAVRLATSSEDGTLKIWLWAGKGTPKNASGCIATLRGHQTDVWRVLCLPRSHTREGPLLISGGNDGSIKMWDPDCHIDASPEVCVASFRSTRPSDRHPIPVWTGMGNATEGGSGRSNGVSGIHCSPCGKRMVVGLIEGRVWTVNLQSWEWQPLWASSERISSLYAQYHSVASDHNYDRLVIACVHPHGLVTLMCVDCTSDDVLFEKQWKDDEMNTVGAVLMAPPVSVCGAVLDMRLLTISVGGRCRLWSLSVHNFAGNNKFIYNLDLLLKCVTGGIAEIASSAIILPDFHIGSKAELLVVGDVRGSISVFRVSGEVQSDTLSSTPPCQFLHRIHAGESVNCLAVLEVSAIAMTFVSGGHDGTIAYFAFGGNVSCSEGEDDVVPVFYGTYTCSALPIRAPTQFFVRHRDGKVVDFVVSGYFGETFIVQDMRRSQQIMHVEAGSWKRKSTCALVDSFGDGRSIPGAIFISAVPVGSAGGKTVELKCVRSLPCISLNVSDVSHSGSVLYCGVYFGVSGLAVGGEDGRLRTYFRCDDGMLTFEQEATLPCAVSIKAVASAVSQNSPLQGMLLAGGSRLAYSIWQWKDQIDLDRSPALSLVSCGSIIPNAVQDHRILCAAIITLKSEYLVALCDSRGCVSLAQLAREQAPPLGVLKPQTVSSDKRLEKNEAVSVPLRKTIATLLFHEELEPCKGSPLLSCKLLLAKALNGDDEFILGIFGSSSGEVSVWQLAGSGPVALSGVVGKESRLLTRYSAHSIGTNALDAVLSQTQEGGYQLLICSGGDDQAIAVSAGDLRMTSTGHLSWSRPLQAQRFDGAAGASLEGLNLRKNGTDGYFMLTLSADQRVHQWSVDCSHLSPPLDDVAIEAQSEASVLEPTNAYTGTGKFTLKWVGGHMANVCDPQAMTLGSNSIAVFGQGFQEFCW